jgi:hypothetical protein
MTILVAPIMFRYHAAGIRAVIASLHQIEPVHRGGVGEPRGRYLREPSPVTVPLIVPAFLMGMRYLFFHSMTAISADDLPRVRPVDACSRPIPRMHDGAAVPHRHARFYRGAHPARLTGTALMTGPDSAWRTNRISERGGR